MLITTANMVNAQSGTNCVRGPLLFSAERDNTADSAAFVCTVANQTDDDWFLFVNEEGAFPTSISSLPPQGISNDESRVFFDFDESAEIPSDVLWLRMLDPSSDGKLTWGQGGYSFFQFDVSIPDDGKTFGIVFVRALNWNRWLSSVVTNDVSETKGDGLSWALALEGTNLFLSVENKSDFTRLVYVHSNQLGEPFAEKYPNWYSDGPFLISADIREADSARSICHVQINPKTSPPGLYRVLHGRSASPESRKHVFRIGTVPEEKWPDEGTLLKSEIVFYPSVICPFGGWSGSGKTRFEHQKIFHHSIKTYYPFHANSNMVEKTK